jgi:putative inorganic carbon (hco3(-)) transporter
MGFYITLLYLALLICSPAAVLPALAPFRLQWWLSGLALIGTLPAILSYGYPIRNLQTTLMILLIGQIMLSRIMRGWFSGALYALIEFGSTVIVFFLLIAGPPTLARVRRIAIMLVLPALYACLRGILAVFTGWEADTYILYQNLMDNWVILSVVERIRFLGFFNDPNDLAQYFLICLPLIGLMWKPHAPIRNLLVVAPLILYLLFGMYLTHSRGVLIGLVVLAVMYFADHFNRTLAMFGSAVVAVLLIGANFAGGRAISFGSGSDRIEAWGAGLTMLRDNPVFGVGFNLFTEYNSLTAHNSFVLCFAELGLIGFFLWLGLLVSTVIGLSQFMRRYRAVPGAGDLVQWAKALRIALCGFIVTGWFLSRTYSILLYVLIAMAIILNRSGQQMFPAAVAPMSQRPPSAGYSTRQEWHWASTTVVLQLACIAVIYLLVRARWS